MMQSESKLLIYPLKIIREAVPALIFQTERAGDAEEEALGAGRGDMSLTVINLIFLNLL